ncbi:MAG: immune inhibitor A [Anaerolineales bacterium]|nr:immune inhibitor A [Anaerolineales bacterium]
MREAFIAFIILLILGCLACLCLAAFGGATYFFFDSIPTVGYTPFYLPGTTPTPLVLRPTGQPLGQLPTTAPDVLQPRTPEAMPTQPAEPTPFKLPTSDTPPTPTPKPIVWPVPADTLHTLENAEVPYNDWIELAERLGGASDIPVTVDPPPAPYVVGAQRTFWASNTDNDESFQVDATLQYVTPHAYFWIQDEVRFDEDDLAALAQSFEYEIYPTNRAFFGSEWSPGVDGDPHIYILYASGIGWEVAGYYSSADEYHPLVNEYSNVAEMFYFNADNTGLDESYTYGVLAHEFQHMIHWHQDRNENSWMDEGFAELAAFLNGYYEGGFDGVFADDPDLQLNNWPGDADTTPNYGASFMFVYYFLERFGEDATKALVAHPENGLQAIDTILADLGATDQLTGRPITADNVFLDWAITNYVQDSSVADGRYDYYNYTPVPTFYATDDFSSPVNMVTRDVHQYGTDYIRLQGNGDYTIHFEGSTQVNVLPIDPYSGNFYFWSNKGDQSDMTLTRRFDFSNHSGSLTLEYWTWYDLEEGWDYLYLLASTDGENWEILITPSGTAEDPTGNSYGWAYTGLSGQRSDGEWVHESVDLSRFAGEVVDLRFEYITDDTVNGEGFVLDDIAIPEIGYFSDFESDDGGWQGEGWVRIENILPQIYRLALITMNDTTTVEYITLNDDITADIPISLNHGDEVILVVTATTRFTFEKAAYRYEVLP